MSINFMKVHQPNMPAPDYIHKSLSKSKYADSVVELDARIGRIMDKIRQVAGDNTFVFYTTDNGAWQDVYPDAGRKLEKPLKYASSRQVPLLAIVGPDELARGEVALRHLGTRQQVSIPRAEVVRAVERQLAETGKDAE